METETLAHTALVDLVLSPGEKISDKTRLQLVKAARILLEKRILDEKKVLEAYFLLVEMQRKGEIEYPVDYSFTLKALRLAKLFSSKESSVIRLKQ